MAFFFLFCSFFLETWSWGFHFPYCDEAQKSESRSEVIQVTSQVGFSLESPTRGPQSAIKATSDSYCNV